MPNSRTTFSRYIIEQERRRDDIDPDLAALLNDVQTACKYVASAVSAGAIAATTSGDSIDDVANRIVLRECEFGGALRGIASVRRETPYQIPADSPRGRYLLAFEPLDGASNLDVDVTVGSIFSILRAPDGVDAPTALDFLQPGTRQVAAGFSLYGPASMLVITMGEGVHGFTLDREIGAYISTHPNMRVPAQTSEFAIDASDQRHWEPPVAHYVAECMAGAGGERGVDFGMRWIATCVAEIFRVLVRGGLVLFPATPGGAAGGLRLVFEANPLAMIVEQAGGRATTGRERVLDVVPSALDARLSTVLGSADEVDRVCEYYASFDRGEALSFESPLFRERSLFRAASS